MATSRKAFAVRTPSGQLSRSKSHQSQNGNTEPLFSPTQIRRMVDAAAVGMRDLIWASTLGHLYLNSRITSAQFAAGKRWSELTVSYSAACRSPRAPVTVSLEAPGGSTADPDSEKGTREVNQHQRTTEAYLSGQKTLRAAGTRIELVVNHVVELDQAPVGVAELDALKVGLQALSNLWSARRKANGR